MCDHLADEALIDEDEEEGGESDIGEAAERKQSLDRSSEKSSAPYAARVSFAEPDAGASAAGAGTVQNSFSSDPDACSQPRQDVCVRARKLPWALYGRCAFSLCGSLIHNAGAWNLVDLFIM